MGRRRQGKILLLHHLLHHGRLGLLGFARFDHFEQADPHGLPLNVENHADSVEKVPSFWIEHLLHQLVREELPALQAAHALLGDHLKQVLTAGQAVQGVPGTVLALVEEGSLVTIEAQR